MGTGERTKEIDAVKRWEDELDVMEEHLGAQQAALAGRAASPPTYHPPSELGPLPIELQGRAENLLAATQALEGQVADVRRTLSGLLRASNQQSPPPPAYLDERA